MRHIRIKKHIFLFIAIWIVLLQNFTLVEAAKIYHPYPIIFVHGIDPGDWGTFGFTRHRLNDYFYNILAIKPEEKFKYFHTSQEGYFPKCDYSDQNNGDITNIAKTTLQQAIISALSSYPPEVPESERKVIIVAHSMGGLVTRSFLQQFPSYKELGIIDKVIFIGTPHLGVPVASGVWCLNKVYREVLDPMARDYAEFYSQNAGSRCIFADESSTMSVDGLINDKLSSEIQRYKKRLYRDILNPIITLDSTHGTPDPNGIALEQLRLAGYVRYCKVFRNAYKNKEQKIIIDLSIDGAKTFLGKANLYLSNPNKYFTILGDYQGGDINIPAWWINTLREKYEPDFIYFPTFGGVVQSVSNAIEDGDGVVTTQSQLGIGGPYTTIPVYHTEEANRYQTILQAIEDAPVIESAYFAGGYPTSYIVIKVKDYLLADIEIADMRVDGQAVDLNEFKDPLTGTYKPYVKFKKDFLKERTATLLYRKLNFKPGEFYVPITIPCDFNPHTVYFKFKNPADKEAEGTLYLPAERRITRYGYAQSFWSGSGSGVAEGDWSIVRQYAYDNFCSSPQDIVNGAYEVGRSGSIFGGYTPPPYYYGGWTWGAFMEMTYSSWLNFDLNIGTKKIKQAKFIYNFYKDFKGTNQNFDVLISRDSSNTWPPTLASSGDIPLFTLNTSSLPEFGQQSIALNKDVDIPIEKLNPYGNNIWQIRPNPAFPEDNCIPEPVFYGDYGYADFSQTMRIPYRPSLFVTFEEKH